MLISFSESIKYQNYFKEEVKDKNICGQRSTKLVLCDPSVDNAEDIQKIIKMSDTDSMFGGIKL